MNFNIDALIHNKACFERETILERCTKYGFSNIKRVEMFLWDLEMFLQIQSILGDKVVLKGGAATQFYIPIDYQRTSIDIDLLCFCNESVIQETINKIEEKFSGYGDLFKFKRYIPKNPATKLPLYTYYMKVPTICTEEELRDKTQEIKIEFMITDKTLNINYVKAPTIFALETDEEYQILPINDLFGDKLTTLGPNTIGIPMEQIKQVFDIHSLLIFNIDELYFESVKNNFLEIALVQCGSREIEYNLDKILEDIFIQLKKLSEIDYIDKNELLSEINNFQSLYLRKSVNRPRGEWAVIGKQLLLLFEFIFRHEYGKDNFVKVLELDEKIKFEYLEGIKRREFIMKVKENLINKFSYNSGLNPKILKGKDIKRVLWDIIKVDDLNEIAEFINLEIENNKIS